MQARATVIVPTFGQALFAQWAVRSVQNQTVRDMEICVICDGSPESMVTFFRAMSREDPRVRVFAFPKSPRTGEPYRDLVIRQTTGRIICYCSHDDLWLPHHVRVMEDALKESRFAHSLDAIVNLPEEIRAGKGLLGRVCLKDLKNPDVVRGMLAGSNCFGLTYGAHTRDSYFRLEEGWATTPGKEVPTDLYMWCKFLAAFPHECGTVRKVTALNFPHPPRRAWPEQERNDELKHYSERIQDPAFVKMISRSLLKCRIDEYCRTVRPLRIGRRFVRGVRKILRYGSSG